MNSQLNIPLLEIPLIESLLKFKIMSVNEMIELDEKFFLKKDYSQYNTMVVAGHWNQNPVWISSGNKVNYY